MERAVPLLGLERLRAPGLPLVAAWLLGLGPALLWSARTLARPEHHPNLLVFALALLPGLRRLPWRVQPHLRAAPAATAVGGLTAGVLLQRAVDIHLLSAAAAFVALYGILGLFVSPGRWRRARPGLLLALAALPIFEQAHHYAGFALRVLTAKVVAQLLSAVGLSPVASETILVLERGVAHVEAACSGLKSVWAGSLLLLAVAHVRAQPAGLRLGVAFALQASLLFLGNVVRIAVLVALVHHFQLPEAAELVHQPLGVLSFVAAAGLAVLVLERSVHASRARSRRTGPEDGSPGHHARPRPTTPARPPGRTPIMGLTPTLVLIALPGLAWALYAPRPDDPRAALPLPLDLGPGVTVTPLELSHAERELFLRHGGAGAAKARLQTGELTAEVLWVPAVSFRPHHPPELCLAGAGHRFDHLVPADLGLGLEIRHAILDGGRLTAAHWLQARGTTTPELMERIRDHVLGPRRRWVLVSVLVDRALPPDDPRLKALLFTLHRAVETALASEPQS
ncbi:MAG: exosortase O [Deltaproteobacteria bacterium]|nr:exosortase O [Deltaproteobacteria bacterium]